MKLEKELLLYAFRCYRHFEGSLSILPYSLEDEPRKRDACALQQAILQRQETYGGSFHIPAACNMLVMAK
jgi:hypothetical protein